MAYAAPQHSAAIHAARHTLAKFRICAIINYKVALETYRDGLPKYDKAAA